MLTLCVCHCIQLKTHTKDKGQYISGDGWQLPCNAYLCHCRAMLRRHNRKADFYFACNCTTNSWLHWIAHSRGCRLLCNQSGLLCPLQIEYIMALAAASDPAGLALDSLAAMPVCGNAVCETGERPITTNNTVVFGGSPSDRLDNIA